MNIEITGANFSNKGAQLMLATVCLRLRDAMPMIRLTIPAGSATAAERSQFGLCETIRPSKGRRFRIPKRLDKCHELLRTRGAEMTARWTPAGSFGLLHETHLDGIVDVSGYAFGDKWPANKAQRLSRPAAELQSREKPVVMLPQMLGPFTNPGQVEAFQELARHVDLIYAREQQSYDFALPHVSVGKLRLAPDITIATPPKPGPTAFENFACIIPNSKLLEPNPQKQDWTDSYLDRLAASYFQCQKHGLEVIIVQHEFNEGDSKLASELCKQVNCPESHVVREHDPQVLKGILGEARIVIGSRFHSLVSALSMGVPSIALGWAHKYDALLQDFGVPELIHYATSPLEHLLGLIDSSIESHTTLSGRIFDQKKLLEMQIEDMWIEVLDQLKVPHTLQGAKDTRSEKRLVAA